MDFVASEALTKGFIFENYLNRLRSYAYVCAN